MKKILITGGSRGIGRAMVERFANKDSEIFINYLNNEKKAIETTEIAKKKGASAILIPFDVSNAIEVRENLKNLPPIDILINNAGISLTKLFQDVCEEEWERLWMVNVSGVMNVCREIVPNMIRKKSGVIINMSSVWGISGGAMECHYSATKGAITAFTKALAKELAPSNIRVNAIAPGAIYTDMTNLSPEDREVLIRETPLKRMGVASEIAELAYFLAKDSSSFITGQIISANGGLEI